jgi:hypothetical protein
MQRASKRRFGRGKVREKLQQFADEEKKGEAHRLAASSNFFMP